MSENITLPSNVGNPIIDTFTRVEGVDTVHMQAVVPVDPATGLPNGATEVTTQAIATLSQQIADLAQKNADLNETLLVLLSAIVDKLPRLGLNDRVLVELGESGALPAISTVTTVSTVAGVTNMLALGTGAVHVTKAADGIPAHLANAGTMHIYNNITVS